MIGPATKTDIDSNQTNLCAHKSTARRKKKHRNIVRTAFRAAPTST